MSNNCQCYCRHPHNDDEGGPEDAISSLCFWCCFVPLLITGLFAYQNGLQISEKNRHDSFIAFWVFIGLLCLVILIIIIVCICGCFDIPGKCEKCFEKKKREEHAIGEQAIGIPYVIGTPDINTVQIQLPVEV